MTTDFVSVQEDELSKVKSELEALQAEYEQLQNTYANHLNSTIESWATYADKLQDKIEVLEATVREIKFSSVVGLLVKRWKGEI